MGIGHVNAVFAANSNLSDVIDLGEDGTLVGIYYPGNGWINGTHHELHAFISPDNVDFYQVVGGSSQVFFTTFPRPPTNNNVFIHIDGGTDGNFNRARYLKLQAANNSGGTPPVSPQVDGSAANLICAVRTSDVAVNVVANVVIPPIECNCVCNCASSNTPSEGCGSVIINCSNGAVVQIETCGA